MQVEVKPSQIILKEEISKIGSFKVEVRFHSDVIAKVIIKVDKIKSA